LNIVIEELPRERRYGECTIPGLTERGVVDEKERRLGPRLMTWGGGRGTGEEE